MEIKGEEICSGGDPKPLLRLKYPVISWELLDIFDKGKNNLVAVCKMDWSWDEVRHQDWK